ncbi:MAG: hypothetical protein FWF23_00410 [Alphaproteobacteria bacterium]|nr:hypothetical protein [Alphaproteobacteria bacterium]MCL2505677.1 hypothetical protein [Alphaproteobacteria bacterium]
MSIKQLASVSTAALYHYPVSSSAAATPSPAKGNILSIPNLVTPPVLQIEIEALPEASTQKMLLLDSAMSRRGFFQVQMPDGTIGYTKSKALMINAGGLIATEEGRPIIPNITIPAGAAEVAVSKSGLVSATIDGQQGQQVLGQIQLAFFINPLGLLAIGSGLFRNTPISGKPIIAVIPAKAGTGASGFIQNIIDKANIKTVTDISILITMLIIIFAVILML